MNISLFIERHIFGDGNVLCYTYVKGYRRNIVQYITSDSGHFCCFKII